MNMKSKLNHRTLLESLLVSILIIELSNILLHFFPSMGHDPLSWTELLDYSWMSILWLCISWGYFYAKIKDSHKDKDGGNER